MSPDQRLLPASDESTGRAKRRALDATEALERCAAAQAAAGGAQQQQEQEQQQQRLLLEGEWELALAGSGTVVTRTPLVRLLSRLSGGGGGSPSPSSSSYGLGRIRQVLSARSAPTATPSGSATQICCLASNEVELGLGPLLGRWRVAVRGAWRRPRAVVAEGSKLPAGALVVDVAFDELLIAPVARRRHGKDGKEEQEQEEEDEDRRALRLPLPRPLQSAAAARRRRGASAGGGVEWATTYLSHDWRVGRGVKSGNVFVFRRCAPAKGGRIGGGGGGGGSGGGGG
jgi:hypothetical protein